MKNSPRKCILYMQFTVMYQRKRIFLGVKSCTFESSAHRGTPFRRFSSFYAILSNRPRLKYKIVDVYKTSVGVVNSYYSTKHTTTHIHREKRADCLTHCIVLNGFFLSTTYFLLFLFVIISLLFLEFSKIKVI